MLLQCSVVMFNSFMARHTWISFSAIRFMARHPWILIVIGSFFRYVSINGHGFLSPPYVYINCIVSPPLIHEWMYFTAILI
jgi:hypothetical protein